jgi:hypothetical protein
MSLERFENSVPRLEIAVSWLSNVVNWVFHGVSTFCRLPTISATVELTSKPVPLVGDPKLSPTVPIVPSIMTCEQPENHPWPNQIKETHHSPSNFSNAKRAQFPRANSSSALDAYGISRALLKSYAP